jgi:hypothetical protein
VYARTPPKRIRPSHLADQLPDLFPGSGATDVVFSRQLRPIKGKSLSMPSNDGIRLNDDQGFLPAFPQSGKLDPEHSIRFSQAPVGVSPSEDGELLSQREVFEGQFASIPEQTSERGYQIKEGFQHGC